MDGIVNQDFDLLAPYRQSFTYDDTEKALQGLFLDVFAELFLDQINDIHHYGMPHLGSPTVVERFTKQDGLAVLRRPGSSDTIMRIIYANWQSLASRRGLAFLQFVLQMIWQDKWQVHRLYHSKDRLDAYPTLVTTEATKNSFLTSRISISIGQNVNADEVYEIAPILSKLVPANIVATITSGIELGEPNPLKLAAAVVPYMVGNFQDFEALENISIPWTGWRVLPTYTLDIDTVTYHGYRTNLKQIYQARAIFNLHTPAMVAMSIPAYYQMDAIFDAVTAIYGSNVRSVDVDVPNKRVMAAVAGAIDDVGAARVLVARLIASNNGTYEGSRYMPEMLESLNWFYENGAIRREVAADISKRSAKRYRLGQIIDYQAAATVAQQHINAVKNTAEWAGRTLKNLALVSNQTNQVNYVQHYTIQENGATVAMRYDFSVLYEANPAFVSVDAVEHVAVTQAEIDGMLTKIRQTATAANNYTRLQNLNYVIQSAYKKDPQYPATNTLYTGTLTVVPFQTVVDQIFINMQDKQLIFYVTAKEYLSKIVESIYLSNAADQLIKPGDLTTQFAASQVLKTLS